MGIVEFIENNRVIVTWLTLISLVSLVLTPLVVAWILVRLPVDYFSAASPRHTQWSEQHPVVRVIALVVKNIVGSIFVVLGIAMLVLPGQGVLTILVGVMLINFPGKYRFERWLIVRPAVLKSINWLRQKAQKPPLSL